MTTKSDKTIESLVIGEATNWAVISREKLRCSKASKTSVVSHPADDKRRVGSERLQSRS